MKAKTIRDTLENIVTDREANPINRGSAAALIALFPRRYTIVLHNHWMGTKGFEVIQAKSEMVEWAHQEAKALCHDRTKTFNRCDYVLLCDGEKV